MKKSFLLLIIPWFLYGYTMPQLFSALKLHAQTKLDEAGVHQAKIAKSTVSAKLYPTINLVGKYDNYSTPSSMLPLAPNALVGLVQHNETQPFSYNIYRGGINISMPIFIKSLYTLADKARVMQSSARAKKRIDLLQNEAVIVSSNANLIYLKALKKALLTKADSLQRTRKVIRLGVSNGRLAGSNLYSINDSLNQIKIALNNINIQKQQILSKIDALTGIWLKGPVSMKLDGMFKSNEFDSLAPLRKTIHAQRLEVKAQKETLYPSVIAHGSYMYQYGAAYNTKQGVYNRYGDVGVIVNIPLLSMSDYMGIKKAKVKLLISQDRLDVSRSELRAKAKMLKSSLPLLKQSLTLDKNNIKNKEELLKIARVSYLNGRMPVIDFLKYEDSVVAAKAALYQTKTKIVETVMQLAVIYANNIEEIIK